MDIRRVISDVATMLLIMLTILIISISITKAWRLMDTMATWYHSDTPSLTQCPTYHRGDDIRLGALAP